MSDDPKENKAKKLAAARKKLKEYQKRSHEATATAMSTMSESTTSIASSEKSDIEINVNTPILVQNEVGNASSFFNVTGQENAFEQVLQEQQTEEQVPVSTYLVNHVSTIDLSENHLKSTSNLEANLQDNQQQQHMNAMQILINEKTQLTAELNRYRNVCREQSTELEECRSQLASSIQQIEQLQRSCSHHKQNQEQLGKHNAELMHKLSQAQAQKEDQEAHLAELQQQLKLVQNEVSQLDEKYKEKCKEHELAQLRIQQISSEPNANQDNRVESLTQNQFMYEQQIRDLQAMVQQFTQDKEQSNAQFQNYVQHLNAEISNLNERNSEVTDECTRLQERERQLVEHISELERELQKHLSQRQTCETEQTSKENETTNVEVQALHTEVNQLKERLSDLEFERHEFQLKIKSQEDRLQELQQTLSEKEEQLVKITEHVAEQPDQMKLLATMESDKIAASRALAQNVELKKQLDEMELRFVELTNDKAELTNRLDSEEFNNREMHTNYAAMEERLRSLDDRFQFKDAEMIRLSHENMELIQKISLLEQQLNDLSKHSQLEHEHLTDSDTKINCSDEDRYDYDHDHHHDHDHDHHHNHDHDHHHDNVVIECNGRSENFPTEKSKFIESHDIKYSENDSCEEAHETEIDTKGSKSLTPQIATEEAVEKLQSRFTYLMSQVADLTEEKQRLEHLVLQLQGETETIGEYIALYQTQRRILKQREYEKAAQARLLQEEREILREKIGQLNQLVSRLGFIDQTLTADRSGEKHFENHLKEQFNNELAESLSIEPQNVENKETRGTLSDNTTNLNHLEKKEILDIPEANEILLKIQTIVTEIKESSTKDMPLTVDHCHCCEGQLKVV